MKKLKVERFAPGQMIFMEGDKSNDKFYVVLKGDVTVFIRRLKNIYKQVKKLQKLPTEGSMPIAGDKLNEVHEGESFGDKALFSQEAIRTASIRANCEVYCLILMRDDFIRLMQKYNLETQRRLAFLMNVIPCLEKVNNPDTLDEYFYNIREAKYSLYTEIIGENEPGSNIFWLYEGTCSLYQSFVSRGKSHLIKVCSLSRVTFIVKLPLMIPALKVLARHSGTSYFYQIPRTTNISSRFCLSHGLTSVLISV